MNKKKIKIFDTKKVIFFTQFINFDNILFPINKPLTTDSVCNSVVHKS